MSLLVNSWMSILFIDRTGSPLTPEFWLTPGLADDSCLINGPVTLCVPPTPLDLMKAGDDWGGGSGCLEKIAALAGHESLETTRRYCEPSPQDLQQAVEMISEEE